ncbi:hypothetical protein HOLleu_13820 [Holothuria leucospilota]|uniref:LRAT domain-containing protein n=1 Tax=Holothuria leucospilota TaxID=206669 RepID=A0A9Q1C7R2_HOLLE|nr:hypothetical protein HOLleu_13820 [Holothuria leucospilota]
MIRYCVSCKTERREFVFSEDDAGELDPPVLDSTQIQTDRVIIKSVKDVRNNIQVGDHIAWSRSIGSGSGNLRYSHHAIVTEKTDETLGIIHYAGENANDKKKKFTVHRKSLQLSSESDMHYGLLFRINYPKAVLDKNPPSLVLKRAVSKLMERSYKLLWNNCESFATFCKRGIARSLQVSEKICSFLKRVGSALVQMAKSPRVVVWVGEFIGSEGIESAVRLGNKYVTQANVVGGVLYFVAEGILCCVDIYKLYGARHDERITKEQFKKAVVKKVILAAFRGVVGAGSSVVGGMVGAAAGAIAGPIGVGVGLFVGSVVGGVGGVAAFEGSRTIFWSFKNSVNVTSVTELKTGDHIVLPTSTLLHPRCHAIVVFKDERNNRIEIIRNDYHRGVVMEWVDFVEMKRINYGLGESYSAKKVIERASSHIGESRYNIITFNCKTFATKQKMKEELNF